MKSVDLDEQKECVELKLFKIFSINIKKNICQNYYYFIKWVIIMHVISSKNYDIFQIRNIYKFENLLLIELSNEWINIALANDTKKVYGHRKPD